MCGRYFYDSITEDDVKRIVGNSSPSFDVSASGEDSCPSMPGVVICGRNNNLYAGKMTWGMQSSAGSRLIINARTETVLDRPMFREHVRRRRCIIPARHFYEWDRERNRAEFARGDSPSLYMAGFYDPSGRFVILTTAANSSMIKTHDRMPLILDESCIRSWIFRDDELETFLSMPSPLLTKKQKYEQMRFF